MDDDATLRGGMPPDTKDRQDAILDAAFHAFATYGFRRTTMEDVARGAGMSRSALYLHYRNKEDLFRSLTRRLFAEAVQHMEHALANSGPRADSALLAAFVAKDGEFMDVVLGTTHGAELMDAGFAISGDIAREGEARLTGVLADWLQSRGVPEDIGQPDAIAASMMAALKGLKASVRSLGEYRAGQAQLARLFGRAISA